MHGVDVLEDVTLAGRGVGAVKAGKIFDLVVDVEEMLPQRLPGVGLVITVVACRGAGHLSLQANNELS